jgi:hypothetical protein
MSGDMDGLKRKRVDAKDKVQFPSQTNKQARLFLHLASDAVIC